MAQRVEAWGSILEFPDDMADADIAAAISKNEAHLNPEASTYVKGKSAVSSGIDAGLSMLAPKKSIADQAVERSSATAGLSAPQVQGAPVRRDFYNKMVAETPQGSSEPDTGIVARTRNAAANDTSAQQGKRAVAGAIASTEPEESIGVLGTLKEGAKGTARNIGAAIDTFQGDEADVISASRDASDAPKDPALSALLSDIEKRKKALGEDPSWLDSIGTVGGAAMSNPRGAGLLLAEQLPNSAAALGAGAAGAAAGSVFGPAGTVIGGIAGLFGANTALETGGKAIEAAGDGSFSPAEQRRVLKEGAIKGGVITGIDAATLGLTNFIMGTTRRAVERATVKTLTDQGIDVTNKAAVLAASKSPGIVKSVKAAQDLAQKASTTLGHNLARGGGAAGLETVGEGAGEYLGEYAATGKADKVEAVIEAFSSLGQSAGEIAFTAARNKAKLETIAGRPVTELSDGVLKYTANRGSERAKAAAQTELNRRANEGVDPSVTNAPESTSEAVDRIISTGRDKADEIRETRQAASDAIQDDVFDDHIGDANKMVDPGHVNDAINMVDAPTPEPIETLNAQLNALAAGNKPGMLLTPGEPMPHSLPEGVQAAEIPGRGTLLYRDDATLQAALDNRMGEALGYGIDEKPGTDRVVTARDANGTVIQDVATDGRPEVEQAAAAVAGENGSVEVRPVEQAMAERAGGSASQQKEPWQMTGAEWNKATSDLLPETAQSKPTKGSASRAVARAQEGGRLRYGVTEDASQKIRSAQRGEIELSKQELDALTARLETRVSHKDVIEKALKEGKPVPAEVLAEYPDLAARETRPAPKLSIESKSREAQSPAGNESVAEETEAVHPIRAHVESLIKRRAPAKQGGKDLSNAIARAKEVMEGKREPSTVEHRYFRLQAKAFEKADMESAKILRQIAEAVKPKALETQAANSSFERFAELGHEIGTAKQALADAEEITGLRLGLQIAYVKLRPDNPARFMAESRTLEVSRDWSFSRDEGAQYLAEELFHAVDVLSSDRALSASSKRLDLKTGDIAQEVILHRSDKGAYADFFAYPMAAKDLTDSVKKAELFARLAVLYFGEPARMQRYLPTAYGAFNEIFRFSIHPVTGEISRSLWSFAVRSIPLGGQHRASGENGVGDGGIPQDGAKSELDGQRAELGRLRKSIWRIFKADPLGGKVDFSSVETRSFKSRLQAYKEKNARKPFKERIQTYREQQQKLSRGAPKAGTDAAENNGNAVAGGIPGVGKEILPNPASESERIAETRKRLKAAPAKSKQATKQGGLSVSEVQEAISLLQLPGYKQIKIAATESDLPKSVRESVWSMLKDEQVESATPSGIRGVYLPKTDEMWIIADQVHSSSQAMFVAMHEAVHRGLRKTFGKEGLDPILRQIYATNKRVRDAADAMMEAGKDMKVETAIEETLADMAYNNQAQSLTGWARLVKFIKQWLVDHGVNLNFTDEMVEVLVGGAAQAGMRDSGIFGDEQAEAYRDASDGTMFSRKPSQPSNGASWDAPEPSKLDNLIYSLQNKHIDMKRVMEAVRVSGQQLAEKFDAYLQEELFHGRSAKRVKDFVNSELKPLIAGLKLRGLSIDELDKYLHARHAEEANALIAQRDPNMPDGGSGMTNQEARDYFANLPADKKRKLEQTAKKVDDIISQTRDLYVSYGLISQAEANSWAQMFKHYVPLMREDKDGGMGIGQGFSIKGKEAKHRTGSKRAVVDILANIALQREKAIVRGEKNRVATSLYGLAKLNPNAEFWTAENVPQRHYDEKTGQVVERADPRYKERANVVVSKIVDSKGRVTERAVIFNENDERAMRMAQAIKNLDASQLEGLMGVSAKVTRYFAAINTQYNPVFGIVNLTRDLQASLMNLSSTPIAGHKGAVLKNIIPAIRAIYASSRGERKGNQSTSTMAALWDEMQKEGGMTGYRDLFKTSEDRANAIKRELDPTAWMNSGLGKIFTAGGALKVPLAIAQKRAGWLFDWLSDYNQTLEGAMRLSVYKVAIDKGLSKARAASIAKNISVNFNRKGSSGQQAGALYAFFNAAMQGTARIGETMTTMEKGDIKTFRFNKAGKQIIVGGITLGAVQALALAAAGFDDDEPPEFVRERSLIIPIGDKKYVTVPMPLGFHAIPNIGRISTEFAMGGFKKPAEHTVRLAAVFAEAFNPIGSAGFSIQTIAPTAIDPLVALSENKDWTGKPIAKEDFNKLSPTPGFSRNKNTASDPAKWIAEAINTISGGNKYVPGVFSPTADQIDYLAGQVTGGVGRESGKAQQSVAAVLTGEDLPPHKIPLVGRFYGNSENSSSQGNAFYSNLKRINELEAELKGRRKDRLPIDEFKAENPEYRLVERANLIERLVSKQRKMKSELIEKDAPRGQVKAIEERITKLMTGFNVRVKELREEARQ